MDEHLVFPKGNEKTSKEFLDLIQKFLDDPKLKSTVSLTNEQIYSVALLTALAENIKAKVKSTINEIRDDLITIRTLMDENPTKAKQLTTNLIKELK